MGKNIFKYSCEIKPQVFHNLCMQIKRDAARRHEHFLCPPMVSHSPFFFEPISSVMLFNAALLLLSFPSFLLHFAHWAENPHSKKEGKLGWWSWKKREREKDRSRGRPGYPVVCFPLISKLVLSSVARCVVSMGKWTYVVAVAFFSLHTQCLKNASFQLM